MLFNASATTVYKFADYKAAKVFSWNWIHSWNASFYDWCSFHQLLLLRLSQIRWFFSL